MSGDRYLAVALLTQMQLTVTLKWLQNHRTTTSLPRPTTLNSRRKLLPVRFLSLHCVVTPCYHHVRC